MHGGEYHAYNPDVVSTLQKAVVYGNYDDQQYAKLVNERAPAHIRDLLAINPDCDPMILVK